VSLHLLKVSYVHGGVDVWNTYENFAAAATEAEKLTTDSRYETVAEAFIYTDLYETDSLKWWENCFWKREGAVVQYEF
jgi:hypothetical protein